MKIKTPLLLFVLVLVIFAAGCAKETPPQGEGRGEETRNETLGTEAQKTIDLTNIKTIGDLLDLRKSIVCDVTQEIEEQSINLKYYIKGQKFKVEGTLTGANFIWLRPNDGYFYMKISSQIPSATGCEWLKFKETEASKASQTGDIISSEIGKLDTPVYSINWRCYEQTLSETIFTPPSNACSLENLM